MWQSCYGVVAPLAYNHPAVGFKSMSLPAVSIRQKMCHGIEAWNWSNRTTEGFELGTGGFHQYVDTTQPKRITPTKHWLIGIKKAEIWIIWWSPLVGANDGVNSPTHDVSGWYFAYTGPMVLVASGWCFGIPQDSHSRKGDSRGGSPTIPNRQAKSLVTTQQCVNLNQKIGYISYAPSTSTSYPLKTLHFIVFTVSFICVFFITLLIKIQKTTNTCWKAEPPYLDG